MWFTNTRVHLSVRSCKFVPVKSPRIFIFYFFKPLLNNEISEFKEAVTVQCVCSQGGSWLYSFAYQVHRATWVWILVCAMLLHLLSLALFLSPLFFWHIHNICLPPFWHRGIASQVNRSSLSSLCNLSLLYAVNLDLSSYLKKALKTFFSLLPLSASYYKIQHNLPKLGWFSLFHTRECCVFFVFVFLG